MSKRKLIFNLAMSLDGYLSREDGSFDWIVGDNDKSHDSKEQFDFSKFLESIDTVIMGRKAYEDLPEESISMYDDKKVYVVTSKKLVEKLKNVEFVNRDIFELVLKLKEEKGKDIWLYGGAVLADLFIKNDVVDEYIVGIIPTILGSGRKLFLENSHKVDLHFQESYVSEGVVIIKYVRR